MTSEKYRREFDKCTVLHLNRKRVNDETYIGLKEVFDAFTLIFNFRRGWNGSIIEKYDYDVVFALYVPLHVYAIRMNMYPTGHPSYTLKIEIRDEKEKTLGEILKESKTIPTIITADVLKLASSIEPRSIIPRKKCTIVKIDGEEYRRVVMVKPFLPLFRMYETVFYLDLETSFCRSYKTYIEYGYFSEYSKISNEYSEEDKLLFTADTIDGNVNLESLASLLVRCS